MIERNFVLKISLSPSDPARVTYGPMESVVSFKANEKDVVVALGKFLNHINQKTDVHAMSKIHHVDL